MAAAPLTLLGKKEPKKAGKLLFPAFVLFIDLFFSAVYSLGSRNFSFRSITLL